MKNLAILICLLATLVASALSAEVESRYVGVIIKVKPDMIIMPEGAYNAPLDEIEIDSDDITELNKKYNLMSIEKMFTKKPKEEVAKEFPERAARAPEDAEAPDLENTFLLKFPEHTDIQAVIDEYKAVDGVIYIEENKEVSIF